MNQSSIARIALWQAIEDYSGLCEILWELNSMDADGDEPTHIRQAIEEVKRLADKGYVELYYCQEPYGEMTLISGDELTSVLDNTSFWREPATNSRSVRLHATTAGTKSYLAGEFKTLN